MILNAVALVGFAVLLCTKFETQVAGEELGLAIPATVGNIAIKTAINMIFGFRLES